MQDSDDEAVTTVGTPVIEALEGFYRRDIDDLAGWARDRLASTAGRGMDAPSTVALLRADEFLDLYLRQIHSVSSPAWTRHLPASDGRLRATLLGRELVEVPANGRPNLLVDGRHFGAERMPGQISPDFRELKAPLCYAHDIVLEDPFDDEHNVLEAIATIRETSPESVLSPAPDPAVFVRTLAALAELAPMIRAGVISFLPRQLVADPNMVAIKGSNLVARVPDFAQRDLAERTLRAWLLTAGTAVPLFTSPAEESSFSEVAGLLEGLIPIDESRFMRRLADLALPASGGLDIRYMIEIRHEEIFTRFRSRQRTALAIVGDGNDAKARQTYRDEMRAAAEEINQLSVKNVLAKFTVPMAIGWATGTMVIGVEGWKTALAALLGSSVIEVWQRDERQAQRALYHHYATLSEVPNV